MSSHYAQHWKLTDMADRLSAIHLVMSIIAETPNAHINREALEGLQDQFKLAVEFLDTPLAKDAIAEADRRFFED